MVHNKKPNKTTEVQKMNELEEWLAYHYPGVYRLWRDQKEREKILEMRPRD